MRKVRRQVVPRRTKDQRQGRSTSARPPRSAARQAEEARIAERRQQVWNLKKRGISFREIAKHLGCDVRTAWEDYHCELTELRELTEQEVADYRVQERERLEMLWARLQTKVAAGDVYAIDQARKVSESLRKLFGIDAPAKVAPTNPAGDQPYQGVDLGKLSTETLQRMEQELSRA